ncbi:MAG: glycosyltransferase [Coriobacteriia bacterium]|nr:glycosyltransferase [Coriobacteriia bacterium]
MRIGFFTDTFHPQDNGVVYVIDGLRQELEKQGHEVFIICPTERFLGSLSNAKHSDDHVIRVRSLPVVGPDATRLSVFMPPRLLLKIARLKLDIIHMHTPSTLGMMAAYVARKTKTPIVVQHHTDIFQYAEHYPELTAGVIVSSFMVPVAIRSNAKQNIQLAKMYIPHIHHERLWTQRMIELLLDMSYGSSNAVIVQSRKSFNQISEFTKGTGVALHLIPNGIDPMPPTNDEKIASFRNQFGLQPADQVVTYFGRMAREKNIDVLIPMFEKVLAKHPRAKLLLCGENEYRSILMRKAAESGAAQSIVFTGRYNRVDLPTICAVSDVYVYPAVTDTQAIVINEAALEGLPLVLIDREVNDVAKCGVNALYALNDPAKLASQVVRLLDDPTMARRFGAESKAAALSLSGENQAAKVIELYKDILSRHDEREKGYIRIE